MASWHETSCGRPDVELVDGNPLCMSCGSLAPAEDIEPNQAPTAPPVPSGKRAALALSWPSSIQYVNTCTGVDGDDITPVLSHVIGHVDASPSSGRPATPTEDPPAIDKQGGQAPDELTGTDSIRILRLSKGKGTDALHGTLRVHHLRYFPEYEAVSYTWADASGDASRTKKLYLGKEWTMFPITSNCEAALRTLRLPTKDRFVWVDAICIDQDNIRERSSQVQLMPIIYATAQRVLIHLGDDKPELDLRLRHLRTRLHEWDEEWQDMDDRLKRPYFFRAWIIQEIAAAKVAIVTQGASSHVWPIHDKDTATATFLPWIKHFESRAYKTSDDLWQLVIDSWTSQARDPRDKVFALLGVISGAAADGLLAEYSLSMEHVYTGFATFAISRHGVAEVLKYAGGYRKSESLPSWVPDWQLLSRDWDIMSQIKSFHSNITQISIASKFMISRPRTELVSQPWEAVDPDQVPLARVTIQGGLCLHGIKIAELSEGYSRNQSVDGFAVWEGPLFITGPPTALETDSVFLLHGLDTATILRRQLAGRDDIFKLVGMCFVRAQTGVAMYEKAWKHHPFWTRDFAEQSILRIRSQIGRGSFHEETAEMHAALKNLQGTKLEEYAEWEVQVFQTFGREAENIWTYTIRENWPILLLTPSYQRPDIMAPVISILEELMEATRAQCDLWERVISELEECRGREGPLRGGLRDRVLAHNTQLKDRAEILKELELEFDHEDGSEVETVRGEIKNLYSTPPGKVPGPSPMASVRQPKSNEQHGISCPAWFRYQVGGMGWWYGLMRLQESRARDFLDEALLTPDDEMVSGRQDFGSFADDNLQRARRHKEEFDMAMLEIELTARSVEILMEQRRHYVALTKDGWKPIVIL